MASPITNIVVLMLENRSYDNVLGMLYNAKNQAPYNQAPTGRRIFRG
ncbi:MAG: Phosphoesterase family [Chlorobi bacterium]|nr:Phosphoesterase family [Chlorobiota bacterium]